MSVPPRDRGPRLARLVAGALLPIRDREFVLGDLEEAYARRVREQGDGPARRRYRRDALASVLARRFRRSAAPHHTPTSPPLRPGGSMIADVATDFRMALRSLRLRPGFSALVVFTLALGVGATTAVFALANQVLLRPLPGVRDPGGAAYVELAGAPGGGGIAALDFRDIRARTPSLEGMAAQGRAQRLVTLHGVERPIRADANWIHGDFFELLGVRPLRGRLLTADETGPESDPRVAVISESFWSTWLGRSDAAIGRTIQVDGEPVTIVGVAGGGFRGAERADAYDLWIPLSALGTDMERIHSREVINHGGGSDPLLIRPRPGVSFGAAEAELAQAIRAVAETNEARRELLTNRTASVFAGLTNIPGMRERSSKALRIMAVTAAFILLIACANVANLLLFGGVARRGDVAVRRAVGASSLRVMRQELVRVLVLALLGSAGGLVVAWAITRLFRGEQIIPRTEEVQGLAFDPRLLAFVAAVLFATAVLSGVLPSWLATRVRLTETLRESARGATRAQGLLRGSMSTLQLALSIPLLVGALLLTRTLQNLNSVDLGISPEGIVAFVWSGAGREPVETQRRVLDAIRAVPGVESAALDYPGPFSSGLIGRARLPTAPAEDFATPRLYYVDAGWFELMGARPLRGRAFTADDAAEGAPARVLITEELAQRMFGSTDVVGQTILVSFGAPTPAEIIGVLFSTRMDGPGTEPVEAAFLPHAGRPRSLSDLSVTIGARGFDSRMAGAIREAATSVIPHLPLPLEPAPLTDRIHRRLAEQRVFARLLRLVSALALLLAGVGLYGVIAFAVAARRREIGIRLALGSPFTRIAGMVLGHASLILVSGVTLGLGGAYLITRVLESRLFEVTRTDPRSFVLGAALVAVVGLLACVGPLRSAGRVDPATTLREE